MDNDAIGLTSKTSAAARAYESERSDALFNDVFATIYASQEGSTRRQSIIHTGNSANAVYDDQPCCSYCCCCCCRLKTSIKSSIATKSLRSRWILNSGIGRLLGIDIKQIYQDISVRTRFLDDVVKKNITKVKQIVLLACGGDFRPYRLFSKDSMNSSSDLTFYLLDVPHVLKYRKKCFALLETPPTTPFKVAEIPCDLSKGDWGQVLYQSGFATDRPTLWLAEGFFHYLTEEQIALLFDRIRQLSSSEQTCIAFDLVSTRFQASGRYATDAGLFTFAVDEESEVRRIFSKFGCSDIECISFPEIGKLYGRNASRDRSFIVEAKLIPVKT